MAYKSIYNIHRHTHGYDTKQSDGNAKYPFIDIAPRSTLPRSSNTG